MTLELNLQPPWLELGTPGSEAFTSPPGAVKDAQGKENTVLFIKFLKFKVILLRACRGDCL